MRSYFLTTLAVAGLAGAVLAHPSPAGGARKSLGFGPVLPGARLRTDVAAAFAGPRRRSVEPLTVAREFVRERTAALGERVTFELRDDTYTDAATGVTHVYVRQLVNGIEVADGDININIKDGVVLSYGDSFYRGPAPAPFTDPSPSADPHGEYCAALGTHYAEQVSLFAENIGQTVFDGSAMQEALHPIPHLHVANCERAGARVPAALSASDDAGADTLAAALLRFMADATPDAQLAADIAKHAHSYAAKLQVQPDDHFVGTAAVPAMRIENVPDAVSPVKARLAYVQIPDGDKTALKLVYKFEVEMKDNWYEAAVSASEPHNIISVVDWASDAYLPTPGKEAPVPTYNVFPWGVNDPSEGNRTLVQQKPDGVASPAGWHALPIAHDPSQEGVRRAGKSAWRNTTTTWGNNVFAHENWEGRNAYIDNYRPDGGKDLVFDFKYDPQETPAGDARDEAQKYINATVTQLFVTSNLVHDLFYRYGFDEVSGNFQQHNFGRGGKENDGVIANAQDGSGYNNANFMTPPDGQNGRCRMYLWNTATPYRDGDLEAGIVIHELAHGLSTRLTGGPANSGCLGWGESGGMGEGWGDFIATTIRSVEEYRDYGMGEWAANRPGGIRNYIYSLNETVNPSTYSTLDKPGYWGVHAIGEVWAEMLWVVEQKLIAKHGFSKTLFPPEPSADGVVPTGDFYRERADADAPLVPKHGNTLALQLVLNGMKLQPCRPSFFDARDAILQADQILTGGENACALWRGFADRGLGPDARVEGRTPWGGGIRTNDFGFPKACKEEKIPERAQ